MVVEIMLLGLGGLFQVFFPMVVGQGEKNLAKSLNLSDLALQMFLLVMWFSITLRSSLVAGILSPRTRL